jgi:hypothetical protein
VSSKIWWKKSAAGAEKSGDTHALSRSNFEGANNGAAKSAADFSLSLPFHKAVAILEGRMIENSLRDTAGNKTEAPNRLQMNRRLFDNKMIEHKTQQTKVALAGHGLRVLEPSPGSPPAPAHRESGAQLLSLFRDGRPVIIRRGGERGPVILVAFKAIDPTLRGPGGGFDSHTLPPLRGDCRNGILQPFEGAGASNGPPRSFGLKAVRLPQGEIPRMPDCSLRPARG